MYGYATILAYKDARVDMDRLDDAVGVLGWKREHSRDNKNCTVSIWDSGNKHWVSKEDTGTESNAEAQKGLASDSFKRACFNLGIGRELYSYPVISIKLNKSQDNKGEWWMDGDKPKQGYGLKLKHWVWYSEFDDGKLVHLSCKDCEGITRFNYDNRKEEMVIPTGHTEETKMRSCKTQDELRAYYMSLSPEKQQAFAKIKDEMKLKLS